MNTAESIISNVNLLTIADIADFAQKAARQQNSDYWQNIDINTTISGIHLGNDHKLAFEVETLLSKRILREAIILYYSTHYPDVKIESPEFCRCLDEAELMFKLNGLFPEQPVKGSLLESFVSTNIDHSCYKDYHYSYDTVLAVGMNHSLTKFDIREIQPMIADKSISQSFPFELLVKEHDNLNRFIHQQTKEMISRRFKSFQVSMDKINELIASSDDPKTYYDAHSRIHEKFSHYYERLANKENIDRYVIPMFKFKNIQEAIKCIEWFDKIADRKLKRDDLHKFWLNQTSNKQLTLNEIVFSTFNVHWTYC